MNLKDPAVSTALTLGLHTCAPTPGIFTWVLGIKLGSLCLYNKHFTDGAISPAFYSHFVLEWVETWRDCLSLSDWGNIRTDIFTFRSSCPQCSLCQSIPVQQCYHFFVLSSPLIMWICMWVGTGCCTCECSVYRDWKRDWDRGCCEQPNVDARNQNLLITMNSKCS